MNSEFGEGDFEGQPRQGQSNVLGIVGFVLAFCLSPIGLLLSLIALTKAPRGFAIAGVVVGLLGTGVWAIAGYVIAKGGSAIVDVTMTISDFEQIRAAIANYESSNGSLPTDLSQLTLTPGATMDQWGNAYVFTPNPDDGTWTLTTGFIDGQIGTSDDLTMDSTKTANELGQMLGEAMQEAFRSGH